MTPECKLLMVSPNKIQLVISNVLLCFSLDDLILRELGLTMDNFTLHENECLGPLPGLKFWHGQLADNDLKLRFEEQASGTVNRSQS